MKQRLERARRALGEKAGANAFEEGRALTPEEALWEAGQAVEYAEKETPARGRKIGKLTAV